MNFQKVILLLSSIVLMAIGCSKKGSDVTVDASSDKSSLLVEKLVVYMDDFDAIIDDMFNESTGYEIEGFLSVEGNKLYVY